MFNHYHGVEPSSNIKTKILHLLKSFCKNHDIPFFDIYQDEKHKNIVGRIYSLLPLTQKATLTSWTKQGLIQEHRIGGRVFYLQSEILASTIKLKKYRTIF